MINIDDGLVLDTCVISNFARIGRLSLLFTLSKNICITKEVFEEVRIGADRNKKLLSIIDACESGQILLQSPVKIDSLFLMNELIKEGILSRGDISSIILAQENNHYFVSDDKPAKRRAIKLGVKIFDIDEIRDTAVILKFLKEHGAISIEDYEYIKQMLKLERFII